MRKKKYTHLFFDLDNTIWDFNSNSFDALYVALDKLQLLDQIGSYDAFFKIYCEVNDSLWDLYRKGLISKKILSIQRFEEAFQKNGTPLSIGGALVNSKYLSEMPLQTKLVEGARKVLDFLHGRYDVAIITNGFKEVQYDKILKSELSKYFRKIFISEEIGAQKPKKEIFEYAIKSMNAPKNSSLMIGDSWDADIVGAMNFGIDQIYFNPNIDQKDWMGHFFIPLNQNISDVLASTPPIFNINSPINNNKSVKTAIISDLHQLIEIL
ncbi:MAG TPA: YjjG family noncanonical pyrimidine nucleotidase [Prolixibacteraceae bacterium]|nr:YjjG family noncanonical pyrimidine nucleotidase [Prolixibacteraceae bacterium]